MRSGVRPRPAAPVSVRGVRLYASSASEDADSAAGLDEDLRLKLLSALQGWLRKSLARSPHRRKHQVCGPEARSSQAYCS